MSNARILTAWKGSGNTTADALRPALLDDHPLPPGGSSSDVTGQLGANIPPTPNAFTLEVWNITAAWLAAVEADSNYTVLWSQ